MSKKDSISCKVLSEICKVDDTGDYCTIMAEIEWNEKEPRGIDFRHYDKKNKKVYKGITISYDAMNDIVNHAIEEGYGDIEKISNSIKSRKKQLIDDEDDIIEIPKKKIFSDDDFDNMFKIVSIEAEKYNRDNYGNLVNEDGKRVIMRRK